MPGVLTTTICTRCQYTWQVSGAVNANVCRKCGSEGVVNVKHAGHDGTVRTTPADLDGTA